MHFLTARPVIAALLASAGLGPGDLVVEFGAGPGTLTAPLAATGARVLAVERDAAFVQRLHRRFDDVPAVRVVHDDLRTVPLPHRPYSVVANLPFAVTTAALRRLLDPPGLHLPTGTRNAARRGRQRGSATTARTAGAETHAAGPARTGTPATAGNPLRQADLIVEWGLARRLTADRPRDLTTAWWAARFDLRLARRIPAAAFSPAPRVDAAHLVVRPRPLSRGALRALRTLLTAAYQHPDRPAAEILRTVAPLARAHRIARSTGISPPVPANAVPTATWHQAALDTTS